VKNMKVSLKLIVSFLIVIALALAVGAFGIIGMMQINDGSQTMYDHQTAPLGDLGEAREFFQRLRVQLRAAIPSESLTELDEIELEIADRAANFEQYMALYEPTIINPTYRAIFFNAMNTYNEYLGHLSNITRDVRQRITSQYTIDLIMPEAGATSGAVTDGLSELLESRIERIRTAGEDDDIQMLVESLVDIAYAGEYNQRLRVQLREAMLSTNIPDFEDVLLEAANREEMFRRYMGAFGATIETAGTQQIFDDTMRSFEEYTVHVNNIFDSIRQRITFNDSINATLPGAASTSNDVADMLTELMDIRIGQAADTNNANTATFTTMLTLVIIVLVVAVAIALALALYISRLISKPLNILNDYMRKAGRTGDIILTAEDERDIGKYGLIKDEVGQCISSTAEFVKAVTSVAHNLETVANGDLTVTIDVLSEKDILGVSLRSMVENLNNMFSEINNASGQVSSGSKQISDGAQSLAQGSTEQAASVQQLSSSISEIAQKTKENAEMAGRAASLASNIKTSAEKGSGQMDEMMTAVRDINESSQNISKVIKSIDDIAFQTNILALNAAVEAARAGQHGKGFAVVAEEVRNLAAKSAEAAKDTESLIADSISKAELGSKIADDTSESLKEIVHGIDESTRLVGDIARSSDEQSAGIDQINKGVDQVAQVVQQNSATAEESAAASEEMSGQSIMLEELISRFKLKNSSGSYNLPAAPIPSTAAPAEEPTTAGDSGFADNFGKY